MENIHDILARLKLRSLIHVVFIPTLKCNYNCPYCEQDKLLPLHKDSSSERWVEFFNSLPKCLIDVSGGEPILWEGWRNFIANIKRTHLISVTTNLSYPVENYDWNRLHHVTASFHPSMTNLSSFIERLEKLVEIKGYGVSVNIVSHKSITTNLSEYLNALEKLGIPINVDKYIKVNNEAGPDVKKLCNAGNKHFIIMPDGRSFTCFSGYYQNPQQFYMGNVFSTWKVKSERIPCSFRCFCSCDINWTNSIRERR
jgi:MoaA/NifB/PqqE/SkfB family radical SAM enzyme